MTRSSTATQSIALQLDLALTVLALSLPSFVCLGGAGLQQRVCGRPEEPDDRSPMVLDIRK